MIKQAAATENKDPIMDVSVNSPRKSALIFLHPNEIEASDMAKVNDATT
jgi:hypothetical protein